MTTGSNFWNLDVWSFVIVLSILFIGMLAANLLRRRVPFLRKSLIPSSVLGGFLILLADWAFKAAFGHSMNWRISSSHLSFISLWPLRAVFRRAFCWFSTIRVGVITVFAK